MAYWRHKTSGVVIKLKDNQKMISTWERLTDFKVTPKVPSENSEANETTVEQDASKEENVSSEEADKQVFSSVVALKADADTSRNAFTERGAEYSYSDGKWTKVE